METELTLAEICADISGKLLDSINLLEIFKDITDGDAKEDTLLNILQENIISSFHEIEKCKSIISVPD